MNLQQSLIIIILTVLVLEILKGRHRNIYRKEDIIITGGAFLLGRNLVAPLLAVGMAAGFAKLMPALKGSLSDAPIWAATLSLLLIGEFLFYWVHRAAHNPRKHPHLFNMHATHHSARFLNLSVMSRYNVFWPIVQPYAWMASLGFYLGMTEAVTLFFICIMIWNTLTHTHFRWDDTISEHLSFGPKLVQVVELIFITPKLHHTHHGYGKNGKAYRNFCTIFSFYDRLFGTLYIPQGRPEHYGIMGKNIDNTHYLEQLFYPFYTTSKKRHINRVKH
ncbi:MAG: sterol desaturase family protein [Spongiibacteraceae bacterium]